MPSIVVSPDYMDIDKTQGSSAQRAESLPCKPDF